MIIKEFLELINHSNKDDIDNFMNNLYNEFRAGRDRNDILTLLNSDINDMRYYGCDIINETRINDKYLEKKIMEKLYDIIKNDKIEMNRLRAYDALYGLYLEIEDVNGLFLMCEEMRNNKDELIRKWSKKFLEKFKNAPHNSSFEDFLRHLYK